MAHDAAYYEAEKKIQEALESGATELDLSSMKLTELPESIGQLKQLRKLDLSWGFGDENQKNQLITLPDSLSQLIQLQELNLSNNQLTELPEWIGQLTELQILDLTSNQLFTLPVSFFNLTRIQVLLIGGNQLRVLPESIKLFKELKWLQAWGNLFIQIPDWIGELSRLEELGIGANLSSEFPASISKLHLKFLGLGASIRNTELNQLPDWIKSIDTLERLQLINCNLTSIPEWLAELTNLQTISLYDNHLTDIPSSLAKLKHLKGLRLDNNPINPELAAADKQGLKAVKAYLRAKADAQITLNEAKLILVGEGEVGKTCLMDALLDKPWQEHLSTHGIEIQQVKVTDTESKREITLNGWDFGGQRVYRPTHQLFFSAPAVYLVVWKPREGPQQGFVKEWIQLVKRREPTAKILVVATHGGPKKRQPDIDRQELWDFFGKDTIIDFFHVESEPDKRGNRRGIKELKKTIARIATGLPEVGRAVPKNWQAARETLEKTKKAYLSFDDVIKVCRKYKMDDEQARLFITIEHRLGHLIHYEHDPILQDIVVLKPDWLATAISFVLDDEETRKNNGLVHFSRLSQLWNDPKRSKPNRYSVTIHRIFVRLMERFDLCYRVAGISANDDTDPGYLIAQLVPDTRPEQALDREWISKSDTNNIQQVQICQIVDKQKGQSATAEGLFYQLIVRLHKYSLGRVNYNDSVHWQKGLVLDNDYNGRALLEYKDNDVHITVRAPYPERFLTMLTEEIKYLVESFWEGLRCDVMVPCIEPCGKNAPGNGLYNVRNLIESKQEGQPKYPCPACNKWQDIDSLLRNAPAARPIPIEELLARFTDMQRELVGVRKLLVRQGGHFDQLDVGVRRILSQVDDGFTGLMKVFTDEAKEGPRLFSLRPVDPGFLGKPKWISQKFHLVLWCEHSRLPLFVLDNDSKRGIYELDFPHEWVIKAAPYLKALTVTLSLVLPVASSVTKVMLDEVTYKSIENQLNFGKDCFDSLLSGSEKVGEWLGKDESIDLPHGPMIRAEGATLRELQTLLKAKDPSFGGLIRVMNKRQEFMWVHPMFEKEY